MGSDIINMSRREQACSFLGLSVIAIVGQSSWDDKTCNIIFTATFALQVTFQTQDP